MPWGSSLSTQQFPEWNTHTSLLGKKPLAASQELPELDVVLKQHHDVVPVDDKEIWLLSSRDSVLCLPADAVNGQEYAPCELGLAFDLFAKHIEISRRAGVLLPLRLQQVDLVIKFKGTVNLLTNYAKGL